jgi:hypothetical protein
MTTAAVFTLDRPARHDRLLPELSRLTEHHRRHSTEYRRVLDACGHPAGRGYHDVTELPWLPVRLFKRHTLRSVPADAVFTELRSSGTTGAVSRIHLDRAAAGEQQRALVHTVRAVTGPARLPMLLVDGRAVLTARPLSARGAGILGMMALGRDHTFVLGDGDAPDPAAVEDFLRRHGGKPFLVFGFTYHVWRHLYPLARDRRLDLSHGVLLHSGGWKRMTEMAVDAAEFRHRFMRDTGLRRIHNFYGMVEQMGTIYLEGPSGGSFYCPDFADVVVRDPVTWQPAGIGRPGVVQVLSTLPRSYPGHSLLTEDLGVVHGVDDGDWPGTRFTILGRVPNAEPRGCADTGGTRP